MDFSKHIQNHHLIYQNKHVFSRNFSMIGEDISRPSAKSRVMCINHLTTAKLRIPATKMRKYIDSNQVIELV